MAQPAFKFSIRGHRGMERALAQLRRNMLKEIRQQLPGAAVGLMLEAAPETPVRSGTLLSTAFIGRPYTRRGVAGIRAGYTDVKAPAVHEGYHGGLDKKHQTPGRNWFSEAFYRYEKVFKPYFTRVVKRAFVKVARVKQAEGLY